jgi:hypothetical protein
MVVGLHGINDVGQTEIAMYWSNSDNWLRREGEILRFGIHELVLYLQFGRLPQQWKRSVIVPVYEKGVKT